MTDRPIIPFPDSEEGWSNVVDLAGFRVERGTSKGILCQHKKLIYDSRERRIWCRDCEQTVEAFDAFMALANNLSRMVSAAKNMQDQAEQAKKAHIVRRSAKNIDQIWGRKHVPFCPHCRGGLLPEDFESPSMGSMEMEIMRREKK